MELLKRPGYLEYHQPLSDTPAATLPFGNLTMELWRTDAGYNIVLTNDAREKQYAGAFIPPEDRPLFIELLSVYYLNGTSRASFRIWDYAVSFPLYNFNRNAQTNNAYPFLVIVLFVMAGLSCAGGILFKEDL